MTPQTVNAYYNPSMNDMNFPAGILQPPLFDPKIDAAPGYGNTGGTIGHELTHGFDDEGRQYDAKGNLKDWWTKEDAAEFTRRAACISDQFSGYIAVDDVHVNGKLTIGEDVADLGGLILAYRAWKGVHRRASGSCPSTGSPRTSASSWGTRSGPAPTSGPRRCGSWRAPTRTRLRATG